MKVIQKRRQPLIGISSIVFLCGALELNPPGESALLCGLCLGRKEPGVYIVSHTSHT